MKSLSPLKVIRTYRDHQVEEEYHWWLLGDGTEWSFLAAYPEVVPL